MGHKIHPSGLRLGITQEHRSKWFAVFEEAIHLERCSCVIPNLSPEGCILCPISFVPPH